MASEKYERWREAERRAHEAELACRKPTRNWKGWFPENVEGEELARRLRAEPDALFDEAMEEMHREVDEALSKPVRQPR